MERFNSIRAIGWRSLLFLGLAGILVPKEMARGKGVIPTSENLEAADRGSDCSLIRLMADQMRLAVAQSRISVSRSYEGLMEKRDEIEKCGRANAFAPTQGVWDEAVLAEVCPGQYQSWLMLGYRYHALAEDLKEQKDGLQLLTLNVDAGCEKLPRTVAGH